ncbi:MAG: hypothetical protein ACT4OE_09435 [Sphingosinicella sp.]
MMIDLPPPDPGIEIHLASRGVSKGLVQTDGVQLLVRPELAFGPVYVGGYAKNVTAPNFDGEAGATLGLREAAGGFDLAASATLKTLIGPVGPLDNHALELHGSLSRRFGPLTLRASLTWSPDDLGGTGESAWWEGTAQWRFRPGWQLSASAGRRERDGGADYWAWNGGITYTIVRWLSADLRWFGTDRRSLGEAFDGELIASARLRF